MSEQVQFGGDIPFIDRRTGQTVQVRVFGTFAGVGVEQHEVEPIRQWIMHALTQSAATYDGDLLELSTKAQEWGNYVSGQLGPQLAQQFQAQGQLQIHGVQVPAAHLGGGGAPAKQAMGAMGAAGMAGGMAGGGMAAGGMAGNASLEAAAQAIASKMGVPIDQARQAAQIVAAHMGGGGGGVQGHDPYGKQQHMQKQDPYGKQPNYDPNKGAQKHDPYGKQPNYDPNKGAQKHDPYGKQPNYDPNKGAQKHDPYGKQAQPNYDPNKGAQNYDPNKGAQNYDPNKGAQKHDPYGKQAQPNYDPNKGAQPNYDPNKGAQKQPGGKDPGQWKK